MATTFLTLLLLTAPQAPQAPAAPKARPPATINLEVLVTDRAGAPVEGARVAAEGPSSRDAQTAADGHVVLRTLNAGNYRLRVERDAFITLEKEVTVKAGVAAPVEMALSKAPTPPPPPPAPTPAPTAPPAPAAPAMLPAGEPRVLSIPDLAEQAFSTKDAVKELPIGCSGAGSARLIRLRDSIAAHTHADADEMIYVVAGAATLKLGGQVHNFGVGSFGLVPRGTEHSITRQGKNPVFVLSSLIGPPCAPGATGSAAR